MPITTKTLLTILILTTGVYIVLSFLRTTRGSGLLRGLAVTSLFVVAGLWGLARAMELEELEHIIRLTAQSLVVVLAILFQPELRRGIVQLGENPMLGRLLKGGQRDVVTEVAQAVTTMAGKRQGALIAFERRVPLDAFLEGAVRIDAEVNRFLLDSIFHHGSALHDGAVVIRGDRIEAATSLFPLSENEEISKSTGTRHRAALGLTEETDALTVAVSEETGAISICKKGHIQRRINPADLEASLRDSLGFEKSAEEGRRGIGSWVKGLFAERLGQKIGAAALGIGLYVFAHQDIRKDRKFPLTFMTATAELGMPARPTDGKLQIALPDGSYHISQPQEGTSFEVSVEGTRAEVEALVGLGGVLHVAADTPPGQRELALDAITWGPGVLPESLKISWSAENPTPPTMTLGRFEERTLTLDPTSVTVDVGGLNPRFEARQIDIIPPSVRIAVPTDGAEVLDSKSLADCFEPIVLTEADESDRVASLQLNEEMLGLGFSLIDADDLEVRIPITPAARDVGPIEKEITLLCFTADRKAELESQWEAPTQKIEFQVTAVGIMPASDPGSTVWLERRSQVRQFVQENLRVYVDLERVDRSGGSKAVVEYQLDEGWRVALDVQEPYARLEVYPTRELDILLSQRETPESEAANGTNGGGGR